ncbi:MAG TPA: glycosyltransferase [Caldimonas sp.]|nr:glycosyltransferase [Caldimonas sp.]
MQAERRVTVVVLTHNRPEELARTLERLTGLPERPRIVVVDNGSSADTAARVCSAFPDAELVRSHANVGAAGRNLGVARVTTPYVAFCDDDTWWEPGALTRAADLLDAYPRLAVLSARVLVGAEQRVDPACERMARSPLDGHGLPGPALIAFMAGAAVMRVEAFRAVGGYEPRFFLGTEEALMALDLAALGWRMAYAHDVVTHHEPSPARDPRGRRILDARNRLWLGVLRLPLPTAWREARQVLRAAREVGLLGPVLRGALAGLPWAIGQRRVVPPEVHAMYASVFHPAHAPAARTRGAQAPSPQERA